MKSLCSRKYSIGRDLLDTVFSFGKLHMGAFLQMRKGVVEAWLRTLCVLYRCQGCSETIMHLLWDCKGQGDQRVLEISGQWFKEDQLSKFFSLAHSMLGWNEAYQIRMWELCRQIGRGFLVLLSTTFEVGMSKRAGFQKRGAKIHPRLTPLAGW